MAARYLDIELNEIRVDTNAGPSLLVDNNPLGKIPTLLTDDGLSIFDSIAIMHYFHRMKGKRLYPSKDIKRTTAEIVEALCDGTCDCLLAIVYERRHREEEKIHQPGSIGSGQR
ncbi:glutathione S-transferase-like protein [Rhizobium sp. BK251]|nr:glutathione S-transferase-like protein [Rhizobium sp. BK251]